MANAFHIKHQTAGAWLRYQFLEKKLNTRFGYIFLALIALLLGYGIVVYDKLTGPLVLGVAGCFLLIIVAFQKPILWDFIF